MFRKEAEPITSASQVLNVMDFEPLAREALPPAHFAYIATGADDDRTVAHNHDAFSHYEIRSRRFNDVSRIDTTTSVFGTRWTSPLYLSAVSAQGAFHADAELGTARAAKSRSTQMMLSTGTSTPLEAVRDARGAPIWQQLYPTNDWKVAAAVVRRAEDAGCPAIALTVDGRGARNNETLVARDTGRQSALHELPRQQLARHVASRLAVQRARRVARRRPCAHWTSRPPISIDCARP